MVPHTRASVVLECPECAPLSLADVNDADASEMVLIEKCKAGSSAAWDGFIKRYEPSIFKFAYSLSRSQDDADDITGQVLIRLYSHIGTFRYESSFISWLFRIVRNTHIDMCVRAHHRKYISLDCIHEPTGKSIYSQDFIDPQSGPEKTCLDNETTSLLNHAIKHLPAYQREVIRMYHVEGKSYEMIAAITGLSTGTIKSRLFRARAMLRERLTPLHETLVV